MAKKKTAATSKTKKKSSKARSTTTRRRTTKAKPAAQTVDGVLKSFEKERVVLDGKLVSDRKKIDQLTKKIAVLKTDLENTKREIVESELAIETLDTRRDKEIGVLLSGMGVDLGKVASAAKPKPAVDKGTPLFDEPKTEGRKSNNKTRVVIRPAAPEAK